MPGTVLSSLHGLFCSILLNPSRWLLFFSLFYGWGSWHREFEKCTQIHRLSKGAGAFTAAGQSDFQVCALSHMMLTLSCLLQPSVQFLFFNIVGHENELYVQVRENIHFINFSLNLLIH